MPGAWKAARRFQAQILPTREVRSARPVVAGPGEDAHSAMPDLGCQKRPREGVFDFLDRVMKKAGVELISCFSGESLSPTRSSVRLS